jgi:hypothetical protein
MTRRRLFLIALPVALVLFGEGAWMVAAPQARIRPGMTMDEVERILGAPCFTGLLLDEKEHLVGTQALYCTENASGAVFFDTSQVVTDASITDVLLPALS